MEQVQKRPQVAKDELTFRMLVDLALVVGCIPALVLNVIFWAIATAFPSAPALPNILALLITLLLSLIGVVLVVRYVDVCMINVNNYNANYSGPRSEDYMGSFLAAGATCLFLAICIVACLSQAGALESWHYILMTIEVLFIGYQTWRVFQNNQE